MCGRATGRWGELRLAKLSLAVSDSFFFERRKRERRKRDGGRKEGHGGPYGTPELPLLDPPLLRSSGWSRATDFQFFFELHATSSRSNSLPRPSPRLLRLLRSFSLSFSCPLFISVPLSSELLSVSDPREQRLVASGSEPGERGPKIDLMRIIPALIAKAWNSTSSACAASSPAGWSTRWLTAWLTAIRKSFLIKR